MRYLEDYKLFKENYIHKYEIAEFNTDTIITGLMGADDLVVNLNVKKGDCLKLFFDKKNSDDSQYTITGLRPVHLDEGMVGVKVKSGGTVNVKDLWSANFVLKEPVIYKKDKLPFKLRDYFDM